MRVAHRFVAVFACIAAAGAVALIAQERRAISVGPPPAGPYSPAIAAGGFVYVSGMLGTGEDGKLVGPDITSQATRIFDQMQRTLEAAGSSLADAVHVSVYLKSASDAAALDAVMAKRVGSPPPARTVVVTGLLNEALVEIGAVAVPKGAAREALRMPNASAAGPQSAAIRAGGLIYLSGLMPRDPAAPGGDIGKDVADVLGQAKALLATANVGLEKVVSSRVYLADLANFAAMNAAYAPLFPADPPARATAIAGSIAPSARVTMSLIATTGPREVIGGPVPAGRVLSPAIRTGRHVFVSGMLGNTADNATDVAAQTKETLTKIAASLQSAGLTMADVAESTVFLPDLAHFAAMNGAYREVFPSAPPARATIGTPLVVNTGLVEIMMVAIAR